MNYKLLLFIIITFYASIFYSKLLAQESKSSKEIYIQLNEILGQQKNLWHVDFKYWMNEGNIDPSLDESLKNLSEDPFNIISDTSWTAEGKRVDRVLIEVQRYFLITFLKKKMETEIFLAKNGIAKVELQFIGDTVILYEQNPYGIHTYHGIWTASQKDYLTNKFPSAVLSGWSVRKNATGVIDSTLYSENKIVIYKEFHKNGQLKRDESFNMGMVDIKNYNKKGKLINLRDPTSTPLKIDVDSILVESYEQDLSITQKYYYKNDTTVVKHFTWKWVKDNQKIIDSTLVENNITMRKQYISHKLTNDMFTDKIIYIGDTVYHEHVSENSKSNDQYFKYKNFDYKYFYYPDEFRQYRRFGWSVTSHEQGLDSAFYKNDKWIFTKKYDENGQPIGTSKNNNSADVLQIALMTIALLLAQVY